MKFNSMFQSSLPMLPMLQNEVQRLLKLFVGRIIKIEVLRSVGNITEFDFNNSHAHLPDEEMNIGHKTWAFLDAGELIDSSIKKEFFSSVRKFYITVATTIIKTFSFTDTVLNDLAILFPENKTEVSRSTVSRLGRRLNAAVHDEQYDSLDEEVLYYLLLSP